MYLKLNGNLFIKKEICLDKGSVTAGHEMSG